MILQDQYFNFLCIYVSKLVDHNDNTVEYCWVLLDTVQYCWILLSTVEYCWVLLGTVENCHWQQYWCWCWSSLTVPNSTTQKLVVCIWRLLYTTTFWVVLLLTTVLMLMMVLIDSTQQYYPKTSRIYIERVSIYIRLLFG